MGRCRCDWWSAGWGAAHGVLMLVESVHCPAVPTVCVASNTLFAIRLGPLPRGALRLNLFHVDGPPPKATTRCAHH